MSSYRNLSLMAALDLAPHSSDGGWVGWSQKKFPGSVAGSDCSARRRVRNAAPSGSSVAAPLRFAYPPSGAPTRTGSTGTGEHFQQQGLVLPCAQAFQSWKVLQSTSG